MHIDFPYFTARDVVSIHAVAKKYVPRLVAEFKAEAPHMNAILARYAVKSVPRRRVAFVLLAGFGLNWDALDLLTERHERQPVLITGPGWHYGFWASEDVRGFSYTGYYWGSSSFPAGDINLKPPLDFTFSSFGDPDSDPRMNFPDLLGIPPDQMTPSVRAAAQALGLRDDDSLGEPMKHVIGPARAKDIGPMLFAIRAGARTKDGACAPVARASDCDALIALLAATGYVQENAGRYALTVPVFDLRDEAMVQDFLKLDRRVLSRWLDRNYAPMRSELAGLTAERQGVPYPALFSQIWHELFGLATRELAEEGVIEDPRGADAVWKGSVPVLWRTALYRHLWQ